MKTCIKCEVSKDDNFFGINRRNIDGIENTCRECRKIKSRNQYIKNKEKIQNSKRIYYQNNREAHLKRNKKYYEYNKEKILNFQKIYNESKIDEIREYQKVYHKSNGSDYRDKNKDRIKEYNKLYSKKNRKRINKRSSERLRNRKLKDPLYKLICSIRSSISNSFKYNGYKKSIKTVEVLGCSFDEFKICLESKFTNWMNWDNKGLYNREFNYGWDIDHIIPLSTANTVEEIIKLNHYSNLQPLCSKINREIKGGKLI